MSKELVRAFQADLNSLLDEEIYGSLSVAEVVGVLTITSQILVSDTLNESSEVTSIE